MAGGFSVTISATDNVTKTVDAINRRMDAFNKRIAAASAPFQRLSAAVARFGDLSGLTRVTQAVGGLARAGADAFQKVGQVVPLIGIIGSAASVAGITRMVQAWTEWGSRIGFTAQRIGISASRLSAFQGAARLAGSSAEGAANGLQALGQTMYDAVGGRAPEAIVMFRTLGIAFQDASGHARSVSDVLPEVADRIKAIHDPFAQAQAATALFGGAAEDLLPFLRQGSEGIARYTEMARRYGAISDNGAVAANRLREAQAQVSLAVEGLRNRIAERLEPILTPMLGHFADWLATSPQVAQAVTWLGERVQQLGAWIDGGGIQRFAGSVQSWLEPIGSVVHLLGGDGGVLGAVEALMAVMAGSFALKVIAPFAAFGMQIGAASIKMAALIAQTRELAVAQALTGGGKGVLGKVAGLTGGLGLAALGWGAADMLGDATAPKQDGWANLLHNMMFDVNPAHWTRSHQWNDGGSAEGATGGGQTVPMKPGQQQSNGREMAAVFKAAGYSDEFAAAMLGSGIQESGLNPTAGAGTAHQGTFQWSATRQAAIERQFGKSVTGLSPADSARAAMWEIENNPAYARVKALTRSHDLAAANDAVTRVFEAPGNYESEVPHRLGLSKGALDVLNKPGPPAAQGPALAPPAAKGAPMQLNTGGANDNGQSGSAPAEVRLHISGDDRYRGSVVQNNAGVKVDGPLVERPMLLGAMP